MRTIVAAAMLWLLPPAPAVSGCLELGDGEVVVVPHGYFIPSLNAFIEHNEASRSGDDSFWICSLPGGPLALYAPPDPAEEEEDDDE